jgi:hypothetical protein
MLLQTAIASTNMFSLLSGPSVCDVSVCTFAQSSSGELLAVNQPLTTSPVSICFAVVSISLHSDLESEPNWFAKIPTTNRSLLTSGETDTFTIRFATGDRMSELLRKLSILMVAQSSIVGEVFCNAVKGPSALAGTAKEPRNVTNAKLAYMPRENLEPVNILAPQVSEKLKYWPNGHFIETEAMSQKSGSECTLIRGENQGQSEIVVAVPGQGIFPVHHFNLSGKI